MTLPGRPGRTWTRPSVRAFTLSGQRMRRPSHVAVIASASLLAVTAGPAAAQARDHVTAPRAARANATGARLAQIDARAGSLRIEGRAGLTEVQARGTARASSRGLLDRIRLTAERRGDVAYIIVEIPEQRGDWNDGDRHASLDLIVEVPKTLALDVEDRSGDLE